MHSPSAKTGTEERSSAAAAVKRYLVRIVSDPPEVRSVPGPRRALTLRGLTVGEWVRAGTLPARGNGRDRELVSGDGGSRQRARGRTPGRYPRRLSRLRLARQAAGPDREWWNRSRSEAAQPRQA